MRAADETVCQDEIPSLQRRPNHLLNDLSSAGHVEQHLAGDRHLLVSDIQQDFPNPLSDGSAPRLTKLRQWQLM